ncbi:c-type lectin domain-containing protein [Nephila pilipes]|uniref:C-type lectin domain-containing protein n=1 Tax=Nephila pilipes TaxID=299642 RepID=A0A8X6UF98_NEPPI|nr:c-type lectin domain-containing protein [Nephila pilipes]
MDWRHCDGKINLANLIKRGCHAEELLNSTKWFYGPPFLSFPEEKWPLSKLPPSKTIEVPGNNLEDLQHGSNDFAEISGRHVHKYVPIQHVNKYRSVIQHVTKHAPSHLSIYKCALGNESDSISPTGTCNTALGLGSGEISSNNITSASPQDEGWFAGRLQNEDGAWCFQNDSITSQNAFIIIDLGENKFVSGVASQGPPEKLQPHTYNHLVAFSVTYSMDQNKWTELNDKGLLFNTDSNTTSGAIDYFVSSVIVLARYVKINVTLPFSGMEIVCLRFELYGCNTDVQAMTGMEAITTPKGKIEVSWNTPVVDTTLDFNSLKASQFKPSEYVVIYRPEKGQPTDPVTTTNMSLSLEDVRLGAIYIIQLQCLIKNVFIKCGSKQVEAYPPCPSDWTGGNEYHCFLYMSEVSLFEEAKGNCLGMDVEEKLGEFSFLVDEEEQKFLSFRILPDDEYKLWLVGNACLKNDDCCKVLVRQEDGRLVEAECGEEQLTSAVCLKDHKGEGSRMRISYVNASSEGTSVSVTWSYEGIGWKTDKLQVKLWTESSGQDNPKILTYSTLEHVFSIKDLEPNSMYSVLLRPAPNIRTEEMIYQFIIIDFSAENGKFGALLTPVQISAYVIWSGSLRVVWEVAKTYSETGDVRESSKYSISHQIETPNAETKEILIESGQEFHLTPLTIQMMYTFRLGCFFANKFHPCGTASVRTDPPSQVVQVDGLFTIYEVINDTLRNFLEAEEDCQMRSGHLTSILSESEGKTLLKVLPNKKAKLWTGAKFEKNGTRHWTDGNQVTYMQMAENSGVYPSRESCCRALNEAGKVKLSGGECTERLPHICKYLFRDVMAPLSSLSIVSQKWDSFEVGWQGPSQGWFPTLYNVTVCRKTLTSNCTNHKVLKDQKSFAAQKMSEFTEYDVTVQGVLEPLASTTSAKISVFTYPKSPLRFTISPNGEITVESPMLVAMGKPEAKVSATLSRGNEQVKTVTGDVKKVTLDKLIPEESYDLLVKDQDSDWEQRISFNAVSACASTDVGVGDICLRLVKSEQGFVSAKSRCASMTIPEAVVDSISLILPELTTEFQEGIQKLKSDSDFWLDYSRQEANDQICDTQEGTLCSWYGKSQNNIVSSYCCDKTLPFVCTYKVKANLGKVTDLIPSLIGNTSLQVQWSSPPGVKWDIRRYQVGWRSMESENAQQQSQVVEDRTQIMFEDLEIGTEYEVTVTPLGAKGMMGDSEKLLVSTLEPRPQLTITVEPSGVTRVSSDILLDKGRGEQEVDVAVLQKDPETQKKRAVLVMKGPAKGVEITGLEPGGEYWVEMTPVEGKAFNYSGFFKAYPSCEKGQIQDGMVCVWAAPETKNPKEAVEVCQNSQGELLDYKTQKELTPSTKALLASHLKTQFWMDLSDSGTSAALTDGTSGNCASSKNTRIMCCSFEVTAEGELDDLKCTCCDEPRPFTCKIQARVDLGDIGDITVEDVTSRSLTLAWSMVSNTKWQQPSYLVTWESPSENRKKREADNQIVVKDSGITISDLKPGTSYKVAVAPYTETTQIGGSSKEITVSTSEEKSQQICANRNPTENTRNNLTDSCTINILKITCCTIVIIGSIFTVFVLIATRMFYIDCLAQIFSELAILGAYLCILVSSAQSYSIDNECVRAHKTLCVAVSALIQFFFQSAFLFSMLESLLLCTVLKDYLPSFCAPRSPITLMIVGFGIPALMNILLAAIASDEYSDGNHNCWLYLQGRAMLPSVLPVIIFGVLAIFLQLSLFDADEPKSTLTPTQALRARVFLKTRWACFAILVLLSVSYSTGMVGANDRNETLNYIFVAFSTALGIFMPLLRIRCDDQIREQLKRGLFASMREDLGVIRVTPAPDGYEPNPLLKMAEFDNPKYRHKQLANLGYKNNGESMVDSDPVWHR